MKTTKLRVSGMTCASCVSHVDRALRELAGVTAVSVSLRAGEATVEHEEGTRVDQLIEAVREAGYDAKSPARAGGDRSR